MSAWLEIQRGDDVERRSVRALPADHSFGLAEGACPGCGAVPFIVQGSSRRIRDVQGRETYVANGHAKCCGDPVGYLYARVDTLFGPEEDRAMLEFGRARVYG